MARGSEDARQIERILKHGPLSAFADANLFKAEEVQPILFCPVGYKPNTWGQQINSLLERLGDWDARFLGEYAAVFDMRYFWQADGLYVIPKPEVLAIHLKIDRPYEEGWGQLTQKGPLAALAAQRVVKNWLEDRLTPDLFRLAESARTALLQLARQQPKGDFFVVPAQTGKLYAGKSPRNASWQIEHATFPAQWRWSAYCVGWSLYTNPHRLQDDVHLFVDCPGDELRFADTEFDYCPCFRLAAGELYFSGHWLEDPDGDFGSASALAVVSLGP